MVEWRWIDNVRYYDYTPATIAYDVQLDAFRIARADIHTPDRRYRLALTVVITDRELIVERIPLQAAIQQARALLDLLIQQHRFAADQLTADISYVFNISGQRLW